MFGGIFGTVLRSLGVGLTLGGIVVAAAPRASVGIAITFIGISIFLAALIWPVVERAVLLIFELVSGLFPDFMATKRLPWQSVAGAVKSE